MLSAIACRIFHGLAVLLMIGVANSARAEAPGKALPVTLVLSEHSATFDEFEAALKSILSKRGINTSAIDLAQPVPASGLVVALGIKAATVVAASNAEAVLNVFISRASHAKLLRDFPRRIQSSIFIDQPVARQARLIAAIYPDKQNVGLLYSTPPEELESLRNELTGHGMKLQEQAVSVAHPLADALNEVLLRSEVLFVLPDSEVYNSATLRNILLSTYRNNVPLVGISPGYVKAGALCALISTPEQIAQQAGLMIRQYHDTLSLPVAQYPKEFEVLVNEQVSRSLGMHIKSSAELYDLISTASRQ